MRKDTTNNLLRVKKLIFTIKKQECLLAKLLNLPLCYNNIMIKQDSLFPLFVNTWQSIYANFIALHFSALIILHLKYIALSQKYYRTKDKPAYFQMLGNLHGILIEQKCFIL